MKTYKFALATLLLGAAGAASAGVPVIQLAPALAPFAAAAQPPAVGGGLQRWQSAGSFASYSGGAVLVLASAAASMPLTMGALVVARPRPPLGAVLLLALGSLIYLGRRRQHSFSLRPARTLLERSGHAPAHA